MILKPVIAIVALHSALCLSVTSSIAADNAADPQSPPLLDTVVLKSGNKLQGQVESEIKGDDGRKYLIFRTQSGGLLKLDIARLIHDVNRADSIDAEYQRRLNIAQDDPNLLWNLYEWCQDQPSGAFRFKRELDFILQSITELDPRDQRAHRLLGYTQIDGKWVSKSKLFAASGYMKDGTSWAPELQQSVNEKSAERRKLEGKRKLALSLWLREVRRSAGPTPALQKQLESFCDEIGLPIILRQQAKDEPNPELRLMYVEAFGKVATFEANRALCYFAVEDPSETVRDRALTLLTQPHYDHNKSARLLSGYFRHDINVSIQRAAFALGELKNTTALMPMIGALNTQHKIVNPENQPGRMNVGFGNGGAGLQMGGGPQAKNVVAQNDKVLGALRKITNQNFGYDEEAWKRWYLENHTLYDIQVRTDE